MKNLILTLTAVMIIANTMAASNIGDGDIKLIDVTEILVTGNSDLTESFIQFSEFNEESQDIEFIFDQSIQIIHVMNSKGEVEMILPVMSNEVSIGMSLFEKGSYKMGFQTEDSSEMVYTDLLVR